MSPFIFSSFFTTIGIVAVVHMLASHGGKRDESLAASGVYVVPNGIKYFIWCGAILLSLVPLIDPASQSTWLASLAVDAAMLTSAVYASRLRLELKPDHFALRGFSLLCTPYASVRDLKWRTTGNGNRYLLVTLSSGRSLKISGTIYDIDDFAKRLSDRVQAANGLQGAAGRVAS